jgi:hypothetical protein
MSKKHLVISLIIGLFAVTLSLFLLQIFGGYRPVINKEYQVRRSFDKDGRDISPFGGCFHSCNGRDVQKSCESNDDYLGITKTCTYSCTGMYRPPCGNWKQDWSISE